MFKIYIDHILINESPKEWDELTTTVRFDKELKGLFTVFDVSLTFFSDGYDAIKLAFDTFGYCHQMEIEIRQLNDIAGGFYETVFTGLIFLKDCEFSEGIENNSVKIQIQDNSFFAKIYNNRNLKAKIYVGKSKNNVTITAAPYQVVRFFSCASGVYIAPITGAGNERNNTCFKLFDVLKFFIDFMSDGTMDFISDTFDAGGKYENFILTNGFVARFTRTAGVSTELFETNWPEFDFATLIKEVDKEFNIGFVAGFNGGRAYLRVEEYNYLFPANEIETLTDVDIIKRKPAGEYLYDQLITGSDIVTDEDVGLSFPHDIRFVGFKKENYYITSTCNSDRPLELVNSWIIDTNTIEDMVENFGTAPTANDVIPVLISAVYDIGNAWWDCSQSNWLTGAATPQFYNEQLNTNNKTSRYLGAIPNNIAIQLGVNDNKFSAKSTTIFDTFISNPGIFNPADFSIELYDPSSNYDPTTFIYTAPVGGVYGFSFSGIIDSIVPFSSFGPCFPQVEVYIDTYSSADTPGIDPPNTSLNISYFDGTFPIGSPTTNCLNIPFTMSGVVNLAQFDQVTIRVIIYLTSEIRAGSIFKCTASADGGGVYGTFNPEDFPIIRATIQKYPLSYSRFKAYQTDPRGLIGHSVNTGKKYLGNTEEFKYHHFKEDSDWILLSTEKVNH